MRVTCPLFLVRRTYGSCGRQGAAAVPAAVGLLRGVLRGAAAGAAGCTALDTVGYLDMVVRGRGASSTPAVTVERLSQVVHVPVPGTPDVRENRIAGLGPLTGIAAGVGMGATLGLATAAGWRPGTAVLTATAGVLCLIGTNGPMTVLRVTDPRTWSASDWAADIVPHVAYALVATAVLKGLAPAARPAAAHGPRRWCEAVRLRFTP
ncbi:hypothetical protein ACIP98_14405 [Streptomyces sp. NPDC088354]|uniref:hypothetical protein n=1 Tax=unclassified Streptomyces TaxID=2593676 RepID=UPI0029AA64BE|nr:hypothetical protein [Streptomyces sp. MI02-7b]MDX3070956.1 hypothetical protein [Streptomyces sp. MI02-7b]